MWEIQNNTPFEAKGAIRLSHSTSRKLWLVAIKATFDIHEDGTLSVAEKQEEVLDEPVYKDKEGESSLLYDSDLFGPKEKIDVILNSTAYQPGGISDKQLLVGVSIGDWSKSLKIVGDRIWDYFLGFPFVIGPEPFKKMPIQYEKAYGGIDKTAKKPHLQVDNRNNVGMGYAIRKKRLNARPLPNIELLDFPTKANYKKNKVAGFGAIPNYWKPRINHAGTFDDEWKTLQSPYLPSDFSPLFYQSAPEDQQLTYLSGGECVTLMNLKPNKSEFSFYLPELEFSLITRIDNFAHTHNTSIQTVIIEPDVPRLIVVWQSRIDCHGADHLVDTTIINFMSGNELFKSSLTATTEIESPSTL